jgi:phenylpropionate dioxygenase-like ring-hydroxylating dioxygenase large terminal subunit
MSEPRVLAAGSAPLRADPAAETGDIDELIRSLEGGSALPSRWYTDLGLFEQERDRVLRRGWHYAAHAGQLTEVGDQAVCEIAGVPVVLVRDSHSVRGFVNICRHRAHQVVLGPQRRPTMQCPYHAWTYGLDGCLRHAPRSDLEPDFDPAPLNLSPVQAAVWGPMVWVNLDPDAPPFENWIEGLPELARQRGLDVGRHRFGFELDWTVHANWKVFLDNAIECYHCPTCHPELARVLEMDPLRQHAALGGRYWSTHTIPFRPVPLGGSAPSPDAGQRDETRLYHFHWIFPTTYFQYAGFGFDIGSVTVRGVDEIRFRSLTFVPTEMSDGEVESLRDRYSGNPTVDQDVAICQQVQRAHATGVAKTGRLLLSSEWLLSHFQKVVVEMVSGAS